MDGEIVAIDESGRSSFNLLQHHRTTATLQYYVFDLLMLRGRSMLQLPLRERRTLLTEAVCKVGYSVIRRQSYSRSATTR